MTTNARGNRKLTLLIRYGAVALIAAWSLLAIAGYVIVGIMGDWMAALESPAGWAAGGQAVDEWIAWTSDLLGQAGGPAIGIVWLVGLLLILGATAIVRRLAA